MQPYYHQPDKPIEQPDTVFMVIATNRMAPRYPLGSRYVARPVPPRRWRHAFGVHAVQLHTNARRIGRVTSCKRGLPTLVCDNTQEEFYLPLAAVAQLYKLAWADYMPGEEDTISRTLKHFGRFHGEWL